MASHIPLQKRATRLLPFALGAGFFFWGLVYFAWPHLDALRPSPPPGPHHRPHPSSAHFVPVLPDSIPGPPPDPKWAARADAVRDAFLHAHKGYMDYAYPNDELLPLTEGFVNNFNGWSITLVDGLDTMWIMGLHDEFYDTVPILANMTFALPEKSFAAFFETVIRHLGGMLSAYALSGEPILLARADDLATKLLPAFHTRSGFPKYAVNTITGEIRPGWTGSAVLWAEALSCQLEYKYLAHLTGRRQYFDTVEKSMDIMRDADITEGQFPTKWHVETGKPMNQHFSVGAFADSAHEYLLKQWLLTAKSEQKALDLYMRASSSIIKELLFLSATRNLLYVTDTTDGRPSHTFEHLSCFLPGLLALGAHTLPLPERERTLHAWAAEGLAHTCWVTYADQASGLGPDEVIMKAMPRSAENPRAGRWLAHVERWEEAGRPGDVPPGLREVPRRGKGQRDYTSRKMGYYLRPETVESFYILWRTTGDEKWRERGWAVFEAIERETKTHSGYASLIDVDQSPAPRKNEMPSFFMAETLKYLYLLFTDKEIIPLDRWVFNTEAHPLPIFEWSDWEKEQYGI